MASVRPDIFISATSRDLGPMRKVIEQALLDLGAHPIEQTHFAPTGKTVEAMIREKVAASRAVIHLVGDFFGFEDESSIAAREHHTYAQGRRSYTQLEHDIALELKKELYVFICGENFPYADHEVESEEKRALQQAHRARLTSGAHLFYIVGGADALRENISRLEERVRLLGEQLARSERRLAKTLVIGGLAVLLLGGGTWYLKTRVVEAEHRVESQDTQLVQLRAQLENQTKLTVLVLARLENPGVTGAKAGKENAEVPGDALLAAQTAVARERGVSVEELQKQLDQEGSDVAALLTQIEQHEKIPGEDPQALRSLKRDTLTRLGDTEYAAVHYEKAIEHYRAAAALFDREKEPEAWATAQENLRDALAMRGNHTVVLEIAREVLATREKALGADHVDTLDSMDTLAYLVAKMEKWAEAEALYRRALGARERTLGAEDPATLESLANLAWLLKEKGDLAAAEPLYRRAWETSVRKLGADDPGTLEIATYFASLLVEKDAMDEAEKLYRQVLASRERTLGPDDPDTLDAVGYLALFYQEKEDFAAAEKLYRRATDGLERTLGADHPDTLTSVHFLASLLAMNDNPVEAEKLYRRTLNGRKRTLGPDHAQTMTEVNNLALFLKQKGDLPEAEKLYRRALDWADRNLGKDHTSTLTRVWNLGLLLEEKEELVEAEKLFRRAMQGYEKAKGPDHAETLETVEKLAEFLDTNEQKKEAEKLYRRTLAGRTKTLGAEDEATILTLNYLADLVRQKEDHTEAEKLYRRLLAVQEKTLEKDDTDIFLSAYFLAMELHELDRNEEARPFAWQSYRGYKKVNGAKDEDTEDAADLLRSLGEEPGK